MKNSRLVIMDKMNDATRIPDYLNFMRKFTFELNRLRTEVQWINTEESLFKFPQTQFPRVEELEEIITPFHELLYRARLWKRHFGVWLDGQYEDLDAKFIEDKTIDYFADFSKTGKTFRTKIKMCHAMNYPYT